MEIRSSEHVRTLVTQMVQSRSVRQSERTRADIHDGPEQMLQSKAGYIDARPLTASSAKPTATRGRTIHSSQKRRFDRRPVTSGLPRLTDILGDSRHVSNVPKYASRRNFLVVNG
jgi:hypothetical protein